MLHMTQHDRDGVRVIFFQGEAGVAEAEQLADCFITLAAARPGRLVFELSGLTFISSLALGELASLAGALRRYGSRLAIAGAPRVITGALRRVRLHETYQVFDSLDVALEELASERAPWLSVPRGQSAGVAD